MLFALMLLQVLGDHDDEEDDDNDSDNYDLLLLGIPPKFCLFSETCFEGTVWEGSLGVSLFFFWLLVGSCMFPFGGPLFLFGPLRFFGGFMPTS